ncbi:MAG: hypothetical protein U0572_07090 [Phycisphaerales bacterium]
MDSTDVSNFASSYYESAVAPGLIAKPGYDFDVGFCGYRFNSETANYTVRFRHYDPAPGLGRWLAEQVGQAKFGTRSDDDQWRSAHN